MKLTLLIQTQMVLMDSLSLSKNVAPTLCVVSNHQVIGSVRSDLYTADLKGRGRHQLRRSRFQQDRNDVRDACDAIYQHESNHIIGYKGGPGVTEKVKHRQVDERFEEDVEEVCYVLGNEEGDSVDSRRTFTPILKFICRERPQGRYHAQQSCGNKLISNSSWIHKDMKKIEIGKDNAYVCQH